MDFLNWRNILAILVGGLIAGLVLGGINLYNQKQKESIAQKLYIAEKLISEGKLNEVESLEIPPPSAGLVELKLGDYFAGKKEWDKALIHLRKAQEILKNSNSVLYYFCAEKVAYILYLKGDYKKSLETLKGLGENIPNYCEVELLKAQNYASLSLYDKMEDILKRIEKVCSDKEIKLTAQYLMAIYNKR